METVNQNIPVGSKGNEKRSVAILSGKGGSGKTLIATMFATIVAEKGISVALLDGDTATTGLSIYLSNLVQSSGLGLANVALGPDSTKPAFAIPDDQIQPLKTYKNAFFLGSGNYRRLHERVTDGQMPELLKKAIAKLVSKFDWVIVDCRGGIDSESLAICDAVDDILLVIERDRPSRDATKQLVQTLVDEKLDGKLVGFLINKVYDNPYQTSHDDAIPLGCSYLYSIPFDLKAARKFLNGGVPSPKGIFATHLRQSLVNAYPELGPVNGRVFEHEEFAEVGLKNIDSVRGGSFLATLILLVGITSGTLYYLRLGSHVGTSILIVASATIFILGLGACFEATRRQFGFLLTRLIRGLQMRDADD